MRVALITRSTLFTAPGGDTVQVVQTGRHLEALGVIADIKPANESINYNDYDLLHFFNIIRPADLLKHSRSGKPFVVSTILVDYREYDQQHRQGVGRLFGCLPGDWNEYLKTVARFLLRRDKLVSRDYLWKGQRKSVVQILKKAALLLPNSKSEYNRVVAAYQYKAPYMVVPNGVNPALFQPSAKGQRDLQLVLCVARIEGIKNQLNLIRALNNTRFKLLLIGSHSASQADYYAECRKMAAANVTFINHIPQPDLLAYYEQAGVHILPSWFETTGLSSIEAAIMGCNIVISNRGDAPEYFGDAAFYCEPGSPESILAAVEKASEAPSNENLRSKIRQNYTWQHAAAQTLKAYQHAIA